MLTPLQIGKRIKLLRENSNLTQSQVADFLEVDQSLISKYEKGERSLTSTSIERLCDLFCIPLKDFLSGDEIAARLVVSFRTSALTPEDIRDLAAINRIALNQMEMDRLLEERG